MIILTDEGGIPINTFSGDFDGADFFYEDFLVGNANINIAFTSVVENKANKNVINVYPEGNYSIQNLLNKNRIFDVKGNILLLTQDDSTYGKYVLRSLMGTTGSIETDFISKTTIFYEGLSFEDNEKEPFKIGFNLNTTELI